jgi:multimeric flavodoxin WrbA
MTDANLRFSSLKALFINTTLTRSRGNSHTQRLVDVSVSIMAKQGVVVDQFRAVDHMIATGIHPDMREHGWTDDAWPDLFERVRAADILVIAGPIWLGDNKSQAVQGQVSLWSETVGCERFEGGQRCRIG